MTGLSRLLIIAAAAGLGLGAWHPALGAGETRLYLRCKPDNDLHKVLLENKVPCARFDTPEQAIGGAPEGAGVLVLADEYPKTSLRDLTRKDQVANAAMARQFDKCRAEMLADDRKRPRQFIVLNAVPASDFARVRRDFPRSPNAGVEIAVAGTVSYLEQPRKSSDAGLKQFLQLAEQSDLPVVVQLDGECWWGARPELWNWWDTARPGYSPANRENVEWTGWSPDYAVKIAWRNWGRQIRLLPPPNLMGPRYRAACHAEMAALVPIVLDWWNGLLGERRELLIGLKVGWESSIGVNAWYYPDGNAMLGQPESRDPTYGVRGDQPPARGVAQIGYAAVKAAGLRQSGAITEADLAEVARRHLEDLARRAHELGMPRDRIFTHSAGWKEGELLYGAAVNDFSCPGWSFYRHAGAPAKDIGVRAALQRNTAPHWAAVEWLYQGPRQRAPWHDALVATLRQPGCRYLCIFNWSDIKDSPEILAAIRDVLVGRLP